LRTSLLACKVEDGLLNIPLYLLWNMDVYVGELLEVGIPGAHVSLEFQ